MLDLRTARYATVGLANTLTGLLLIFICKGVFDLGDLTANAAGYGTGIVLGFLLNRHWTFQHAGDPGGALARYLMVLAVAYLSNLAAVIYLVDVLKLNSYLAQAAAIAPYAIAGYLGSRYFVFISAKVEK